MGNKTKNIYKMTYKHTFDKNAIKLHNITHDDLQLKDTTFTKEDLIGMYKDLLNIRHIETTSKQLFDQKQIRGFCHLVTGQENIYVAYKNSYQLGDHSTSSYRCHGLAYATGTTAESILAEQLGKQTGCCGGKGGSMHLYNKT